MIRAVIFDFNGVPVDDEHVHFELFRDLLGERGIEMTEADYNEIYLGFDDRRCFEEALARHGREASAATVSALIGEKAFRYQERAAAGLRFFPGGADAVRALAARWPVAICSGALRAEIELALGMMGVRQGISAVVAAEDTTRCKPDPEGYLLALDALRSIHGEDLEAGHCLVVEDSLAGVESGKGAGMWVVGVTNSYGADALRSSGADTVIASLEGFGPEHVERMFWPEVSP